MQPQQVTNKELVLELEFQQAVIHELNQMVVSLSQYMKEAKQSQESIMDTIQKAIIKIDYETPNGDMM